VRRLSELGEDVIEAAIMQAEVAVASLTLERVAKIVGCWPGAVSRTSGGARLRGGDERDDGPEVLVLSSSALTDEEWLEKFGPSA
jgi:hypothetical protein